MALTARRGLVGRHGEGGLRCAGTGSPPNGYLHDSGRPIDRAGGGVVRLADAALVRDERRRVVLAERLAEAEVLGEAVAQGSLELVSKVFPAVLDALEAVIKPPEVIEVPDGVPSAAADEAGVAASVDGGGLLERLIRADPERARRVLATLTDTTGCR